MSQIHQAITLDGRKLQLFAGWDHMTRAYFVQIVPVPFDEEKQRPLFEIHEIEQCRSLATLARKMHGAGFGEAVTTELIVQLGRDKNQDAGNRITHLEPVTADSTHTTTKESN